MRNAIFDPVIIAPIQGQKPNADADYFSLVLVLEGKLSSPARLCPAKAPFIACLKAGESPVMEARMDGNQGYLVMFRPQAVNEKFARGIAKIQEAAGDPCLGKDIELIGPFAENTGFSRELIPQETDFLAQILRRSQSLYRAKDDPYWIGRLEAFLREVLYFLRQKHQDMPCERASRASQLREFIHAHYREKMGLDELARIFGTNRTTLQRLFKAEYDENIFEYVADYRIRVAMDLARSTDLTMKEIGYRVGFKDYSHFFREFSRRCGVTPIEFRKSFFAESIGA